jgi:GntR family transcriptional repressor for pyruvate dehydrogenase complex
VTAADAADGGVQVRTLLHRVNTGRTSELIVDQIRDLILGGQLTPGDRLPPERELCVLFGVSRVPLREAMRILESRGLVEIKTGSRGGAFVTAPNGDRLGENLTDMLSMSTLDAADVTQVRVVLELGFIPVVCERATEADLDELQQMCEQATTALAAGTYTMEQSAAFHVRLSRSAHNAALDVLIESFRSPLLASLEQAHNQAPEMGRRGNDEHLALVAALRRRDRAAAEQILREHLARTAGRVAHH